MTRIILFIIAALAMPSAAMAAGSVCQSLGDSYGRWQSQTFNPVQDARNAATPAQQAATASDMQALLAAKTRANYAGVVQPCSKDNYNAAIADASIAIKSICSKLACN